MKKEIFDIIKREILYIGMLFLLGLIAFKIAFFKEDLITVLRTVLSLFWLFALPGYCLMIYWSDKIEFVERFAIGIFLSAAITGVLSYYLGLLGLNIKFHAILFPILISVAGLIAAIDKRSN